MNKPKVTVYIPNFNYEKYIEKAINSVLEQTYKNIEIIIIDDGSTDNSRNIINKYIGNKKVIRIIQKNKGLIISSNLALKLSNGSFILRLDADDWLDKNCIELLVNTISKDNKIGLVFPDYYLTSNDGEIIKQVRRHDFSKVKLLDQPAHGACSLIRKKFLSEAGGYSENIFCQDGYDLWMKFIGKYKIKNLNLPLFYYRQHAKSLSKNEKKILYTRSKIFQKYAKDIVKKLSVAAVIPIRGSDIDSNSLVFKKIDGKFLIDHTIETSIKTKTFSKILISTPDKKIIDYVNKNYKSKKISCHLRDRDLGEFNISLKETLKNSLNIFNKMNLKIDALMSLTIDYPLRSKTCINSAISVMKIFNLDQVISVTKENDQFYQHNGNGLEPIQKINSLHLEREELYRQTGTLNLLRNKIIRKDIEKLSIGHIIVDKLSALEIRTPEDLSIGRIFSKKL